MAEEWDNCGCDFHRQQRETILERLEDQLWPEHRKHKLIELADKIRDLTRCILGEEFMAQVQVTVTFNIAPAVQPLAATPSSATDDLTVGQAAPSTPLSVISGGQPPYQQPTVDPLSPNQLPPGLTASVDASGNVTATGTPTTAGTGTVILDIDDSAPAPAAKT